MKRVWWMDAFGMMLEPRSGHRTTIEQIQGSVVSVTAAHADDRQGMVNYTYIVVTDEPTVGDLMSLPALSDVVIIGQEESREEVMRTDRVTHQRPRRLIASGRPIVWFECYPKRLD